MRHHQRQIRVRCAAVEEICVVPDKAIERRELLGGTVVPVRALLGRVAPLIMGRHEPLSCRVGEGDPAADQAVEVVLLYVRPIPPAGRGSVRAAKRLGKPVGQQGLIRQAARRGVVIGLGGEEAESLVIRQMTGPEQAGVRPDRHRLARRAGRQLPQFHHQLQRTVVLIGGPFLPERMCRY